MLATLTGHTQIPAVSVQIAAALRCVASPALKNAKREIQRRPISASDALRYTVPLVAEKKSESRDY